MCISTTINKNSKSNYGTLPHYQLQMTVAPHQEEKVSNIWAPARCIRALSNPGTLLYLTS